MKKLSVNTGVVRMKTNEQKKYNNFSKYEK